MVIRRSLILLSAAALWAASWPSPAVAARIMMRSATTGAAVSLSGVGAALHLPKAGFTPTLNVLPSFQAPSLSPLTLRSSLKPAVISPAAADLPADGTADFESPQVPAKEASAQVGYALAESKSLGDALKRMVDLKLIEPGEFSLKVPGDAAALRYRLQRFWHASAPHALPVAVDEGWPLPTVTVRNDDTVFHVHGLIHGQGVPAGAAAVRRLVTRLKSAGDRLYSEELFPKSYGYDHGIEVLHQGLTGGRQAGLRKVPKSAVIGPWLRLAGAVAAAAVPAAFLIGDPSNMLAWTALGVLGAAYVMAALSFFPVLRLYFRMLAKQAENAGDLDLAEHLRAYAEAAFRRPFDWKEFQRVELPPALKAAVDPAGDARALSIASAVLNDARERLLNEVHVLTGANNMQSVARHLEGR